MGYNSGNNAYDLSLFEPRQSRVRTNAEAGSGASRTGSKVAGKRPPSRSKTTTPERKSKSRSKNDGLRSKLAGGLAIGMFIIIAFAMLIGGRADYLEVTRQIELAKADLTELEQEYEVLKVKFDTKMSDSAVEEYAVNVLGMQKRENSQTEYISLNVGNVFEMADTQPNDWYQASLEEILSYSD